MNASAAGSSVAGKSRFASLSIVAAAVLAVSFASAPAAHAQRAGANDEERIGDQETRETPALSEAVYAPLAEAQECAEMGDFECAMDRLTRVREMDNRNSYETALMWQFYAFIYFEQENTAGAMEAYENLLMQPDLPLGLEQDSTRTLAQLYVQEEQYQNALDMIDRWFQLTESPGPDMYILKANVHYQMQQYEEGLEPVQTALRIAEERGQAPEEGWYQLLNVFYFELEDYPNVIETLRILLEGWPKKDYLVQLAGIYGQEGQEDYQLALFQTAHEMGWLERGNEYVTLAQMLLSADVPYQAAQILEQGLENGDIDSTEQNWRTLAQAWQLAQNYEESIPPLTRAASLSDDGELYRQLANSYANLARWEECVEASRNALRQGLDREDQANLLLGNCLVELKQYDQAKNALRAAARDDRSRSTAQQWIEYIESEENREAQLEASLTQG